jgi:hypothetical protein
MKLSIWQDHKYRQVEHDDDGKNEPFLDKEIALPFFQEKRESWKLLKIFLAISIVFNLVLVIFILALFWRKGSKMDVVSQMYCECSSLPSVKTMLT